MRGMTPWPGAFTHIGGKLLKVLATRRPPLKTAGAPGSMVAADAAACSSRAATGALEES